MRLIRILVVAAIVIGVPILFASSASATINGPCSASGRITTGSGPGKTYHATQKSVVIPRKGDVHWKGAIKRGGGKRNIEGKVYIKLPAPIGKIEIGGSLRYTLPSMLRLPLPVLIAPFQCTSPLRGMTTDVGAAS